MSCLLFSFARIKGDDIASHGDWMSVASFEEVKETISIAIMISSSAPFKLYIKGDKK